MDSDNIRVNSVIIYRARNLMTLIIGVVQVLFFALALKGHLNITVPDTNGFINRDFITALADDNFWAGCFIVAGILVLTSFIITALKATAMSLSAATLGVWGSIQYIYAVNTIRPVSWAGPSMAIALSIIAIGLANSWAVIFWERKLKDI